MHMCLAAHRGRVALRTGASHRPALSVGADVIYEPEESWGVHRRMLEERMRDPEFRAENARLP